MASPALTLRVHHRTVRDRPSPWAVVTAAAIPVVLVVGWIVADAVQPSTFDPVRQTVSVAAGLGAQDRWIMTVSLYVVAAAYVLTAVGVHGLQLSARWWLVATGAAAAGIAALPEPAGGTTVQHAVVTGAGAVLMAGWPLLARWTPAGRWVVGTRATVAVTVLFLAMLGWLLVETRHDALLGLAERVCSGVQVCWPFVVAVTMRRHPLHAGRQVRSAVERTPRGDTPPVRRSAARRRWRVAEAGVRRQTSLVTRAVRRRSSRA